MDGFFWPVILIAVGCVLLTLELFVPSGGALGVAAGLSLLLAIGVGFLQSLFVGATTTMAVAVIVPGFLAIFVHLWPRTPIGRQMLLLHETEDSHDEEDVRLQSLVGQRGQTKSKMMPSGAVLIDGRTYDAATEGMPLEPGVVVEVVGMSFKRLIVRQLVHQPLDAMILPTVPEPVAAEAEKNILDQPAPQLELSPFEEPLI